MEKGSVKIEDSVDKTGTDEKPEEVTIEDSLIFENKTEAQKEFLKVLNKEGAAAAKEFSAKLKIKSES